MAIVFGNSAITYTFLDTSGEKVTRTYAVNDPTITYLQGVASANYGNIQALTDSVITQYELSVVYRNDAAIVPAAANNKKVLLISDLLRGDPTERGYFSVPSPKGTLFYALTGEQSNIMRWPNPSVAALLLNFVTNADGGYENFLISDGERLANKDVVGRKVHRHRG